MSNSVIGQIMSAIRGPWLALLVTPTLTGLVTSLAWAVGSTTWEPAVNLSNTPGRSSRATLASDLYTGDLFVVWTDDGVAEQEEILGRRWHRATQTWLPVENLSQSEEWQRDGGPVLVFDHQGRGLLIWTRTYSASQGAPDNGHDILWRSWDGIAWSPEAVLLHGDSYLPGSPGTLGLIPVATSDAVLLFITWGKGYRMAEYKNGTWSAVTPWIYLDVFLAQMLMDDESLIHVAAYGQNSAQWDYNRYFYDAYYLTYDGASWSEPLNLSSTDGVADSVGMAFDGQGRLHFLWSDPDSVFSDESLRSAIYERVYDGGAWTPNAQVTTYNDAQAISAFSLTTDVSNTLHLAWSEGFVSGLGHIDLDIYYQTGDGSAWGPEEKVYTSTADSRYPVLFVDSEAASLVWEEGPIAEPDILFSRQAIIPPDLCRGLTDVRITGAITGTAGLPHTFTAWAEPLTATLTITYTWEADEQTPIVLPGGHLNRVDLTWEATGTKTISVTAENCGGMVTSTHAISITAQRYRYSYLPLIIKGDTQ